MSESKGKDKLVISKKKLVYIAVVFATIALLIAVFLLGYNIGQDVGKKQATVDQSIGAISGLLGTVANPSQSTSGKVVGINGSEITVETNAGEQETIRITEKTKITNKSKIISVNDIEINQRASVFFGSTQDDGEFAARIIVN